MTEFTILQQNFRQFLPEILVSFNEPMSAHTSFRIGGPAEVMAFPKSRDELSEILKMCVLWNIKPAILGAGTNVLAPDQGMNGIVICLKDGLSGMEVLEGNRIRVLAGVTMARLSVFAANNGLSGLEFAQGIPGTVGGGIYMNAGAYGGEMGNLCQSVEVMDLSGNIRSLSREEMQFSYRHSVLEESGELCLSAVLQLTPGSTEEIKTAMKTFAQKRSASQPLNYPSAGSAFKRPQGGYAAALIDAAGLKGFQVGGAAISEKHAGFAVNLGGATAEDVRELLRQVSQQVYEKSGIRLEPEIRIL